MPSWNKSVKPLHICTQHLSWSHSNHLNLYFQHYYTTSGNSLTSKHNNLARFRENMFREVSCLREVILVSKKYQFWLNRLDKRNCSCQDDGLNLSGVLTIHNLTDSCLTFRHLERNTN